MEILVIADLHWRLPREETEALAARGRSCRLCTCLGDIPLDQLVLIKDAVAAPIVGVPDLR